VDHDLDALRHRADFKALLARLGATKPKWRTRCRIEPRGDASAGAGAMRDRSEASAVWPDRTGPAPNPSQPPEDRVSELAEAFLHHLFPGHRR